MIASYLTPTYFLAFVLVSNICLKIIHIEVSFFVCEMSNDSECQVNFGRNTAN